MATSLISTEFKAVMRCWPTGVAVITTKYKNNFYGLTVNSFTSVSLNPPLISFCLNKNSGSFTAFTLTNKFVVNILAQNQQDIAKNFATKQINKFSNIRYSESKHGFGAIIDGAQSILECNKLYEYLGGDHVILVAEVKYFSINNKLMPLLYYEMEYRMIK